jgi:hypothetical protein
MAKVLFYDIETAPNLAYVWGQYDQNVIEQHREWYMMCFSYKWEGQKTTKVVALPDFELYATEPENDREVTKTLWELFDEADIVIAHNGDKFDMRKANARFIAHHMTPPTPVHQVDTLKIARKYFMFNSNKLGDLGEHLGLGNKEATGGFGLWKGCMMGDEKSWRTMKKYAKQDVDLLAMVYHRLRPWMSNHPNRALFDNKPDSCPTCGHPDLIRRGFRSTKVAQYVQLQCKACGAYCRGRVRSDATSPNLVP